MKKTVNPLTLMKTQRRAASSGRSQPFLNVACGVRISKRNGWSRA